jgi:hypothetical protein
MPLSHLAVATMLQLCQYAIGNGAGDVRGRGTDAFCQSHVQTGRQRATCKVNWERHLLVSTLNGWASGSMPSGKGRFTRRGLGKTSWGC